MTLVYYDIFEEGGESQHINLWDLSHILMGPIP